jgi:hypothetical protein
LAPFEASALPEEGSIALWSGFSALAAPEAGGAELRSCAPPDVSVVPDCGSVACLAVSCETPGCVGGCIAESSAASAGERPSKTATAVPINKRFMLVSLPLSLQLATNYYDRRIDIQDDCKENVAGGHWFRRFIQ